LAVAVTAISKTKQMGEYTEQANHANFDYTVFWFE
jgi:hypothetical protein